MSEHSDEHPHDIRDEDLPDDLRPDDNPLARDLDQSDGAARSREELDLEGGKVPVESSVESSGQPEDEGSGDGRSGDEGDADDSGG